MKPRAFRHLLVLTVAAVLLSCSQITLTDLARLHLGMTSDQSDLVLGKDPIREVALGSVMGSGPVTVAEYNVSAAGVMSTYMLAFASDTLLYWGYPHEFARANNVLVNRIGELAVARLAEERAKEKTRKKARSPWGAARPADDAPLGRPDTGA